MAIIISTNTTWKSGEVHNLGSDIVQIAYGATLTIESGVIVNGGSIQAFGTLQAAGNTNSKITFNNVDVNYLGTSTQYGQVNISHANINGGSIQYPTGNAVYGSLNLRDSVIKNAGYMYIWYPTSDVHIERNIFDNSGGLSIGHSDNVNVYVTNNTFVDQTTGYAIQNWAAYSGETIVERNSFLSTDKVAMMLPNGYDSAKISAASNYFGTTNVNVINTMIHDKSDNLSSAEYISNSFTAAPSQGTPTYDNTAPMVTTFTPADDAIAVPIGNNIVLAFNENILRGDGTIVIKTDNGDTVASYVVASSSNISISGKALTINPSTNLAYSTSYSIEITAGAIKDLAGNAYAGTSTYNFRTAADPLAATNGNDTLIGSSQADTIHALGGNDFITGGAGNDIINGGTGTDTASYSGTIDQYRITINNASQTVVVIDTQAGRNGTDTLTNVEKVLIGSTTFDLFSPALATTPKHSQSRDFLFDSAYYLLSHPELSGSVSLNSAFDHYLTTGAAQGFKPNNWFDPTYYENRWNDLKNANLDDATLFLHYNLYGVWEGRSAGPKFDQYDGERYLQNNPDVAAYVDANVGDFLGSRTNGAIAHYIIYGANEGRVAYDLSGNAISSATLIGIAE